ncbi:pilus assembly protein [Lactonifactor longoviformis]|uniref:TadE-like protein n=1 Tax=Lactonifactor longoviformis DSM 17459 TaxID=1122155 RepID=A0A1M4WJ17_9CLOT|nr:TadE family protein [Lactonifactor longoviformis]POP30959.1 pilus assembly protein [Lactonifactor longoviformis]SHE81063.1 TadE-like protein [Lactonifactor longoviformis DSM 17459]
MGTEYEQTGREQIKGYRGSFTVEAALCMPLVLMVLTVTLYLCFFVYHQAWYTAAAYEGAASAGTAAARNLTEARHIADSKIKSSQGNGGILSGTVQPGISAGSSRIVITYRGGIGGPFLRTKWEFQGKGEIHVLRPVEFIRKIRKAEAYAGGL